MCAANREPDSVRDHWDSTIQVLEENHCFEVLDIARFPAESEVGPNGIGDHLQIVDWAGRVLDEGP